MNGALPRRLRPDLTAPWIPERSACVRADDRKGGSLAPKRRRQLGRRLVRACAACRDQYLFAVRGAHFAVELRSPEPGSAGTPGPQGADRAGRRWRGGYRTPQVCDALSQRRRRATAALARIDRNRRRQSDGKRRWRSRRPSSRFRRLRVRTSTRMTSSEHLRRPEADRSRPRPRRSSRNRNRSAPRPCRRSPSCTTSPPARGCSRRRSSGRTACGRT